VDFCLCRPTGQVLAPCRAWTDGDRLLIGTQAGRVAAFLERVELMVVMEDVVARAMAREFEPLCLQGPGAQSVAEEAIGLQAEGCIALDSDRCGSGGVDVWTPNASVRRRLLESLRSRRAPIASLEIARIEAGRPVFGLDIDDRTLPPELGPDFERRHMSYVKGCYVGQEVLMRIHSRGHTNRTWAGLLAEAPLRPGLQVCAAGDGQAVGRVTSAAISPKLGPIAAAMLRKVAAEPGTPVRVEADSGLVAAEVRRLPLLTG
jgi:folate-binding protein YgfZ